MTARIATLLARHGRFRIDGGSLGLPALAAQAALVRMLGPLSSFALAVLLARSLGAAGSGEFYTALTLVTALAIVAKFGLETALQRFIGMAHAAGDLVMVAGFYRQALITSSLLALALAGLCVVLATPIAGLLFKDTTLAPLLRILGAGIVPFALLGINAAALKALGRPVLGGFFEAAAWPLLTICTVGASVHTLAHTTLIIAAICLAAATLAALLAYIPVRRLLPSGSLFKAVERRVPFSSCRSFMSIELVNYILLWMPLILLPAMAGTAEAGLFNISHRLAAQLGLLLLVFASITAPRFAAYHDKGRHAEMASLAGHATRTMLLFAIPPVVILQFWSEHILGIFGSEFVAAGATLQLLLIGQLVNLASGPVGYLLAMTGHERQLRNSLFVTATLMLPAAMLLIPAYGAEGAAATASLGLVFHNLMCSHLVAKNLRLPFFLAIAR